ncbi:hypothetical protein [Ciceribacter selenitireducens]
MQYFVIAGLSGELFEATKKNVAREFRSSPVIGRAVRTSQAYSYSDVDIKALANAVRDALERDISDGKIRLLALLYAPHENVERLLNNFAPATLNFRLPADINSMSKDKALSALMRAVRSAQGLAANLNTIFDSEIRRSPFALPFANYKVDSFAEKLIAASNFNHDDNPVGLRALTGLPTATTVSPKTTVFSDARDLLFVPAKRREFHGHDVSGDLPFTWLRGAFRVGRSIPVGFHYDVRPDRPPLSRFEFEDCEKGTISPKDENTYINVTPNDRTRLGKK